MNAAPSPAGHSDSSGSYILTHLDLYDWGAFVGRHGVEIDLAGTGKADLGSLRTALAYAMAMVQAKTRANLLEQIS